MSRFREPQDPLFSRMNSSAGFDWRLAPYDIALSRAHVTMLASRGIIETSDSHAIIGALGTVEAELEGGLFEFLETDEDIHMAIERRVTALIGDAGARMHTARSRNDQVATGLVLWIRAHARAAADACGELETVLLALAEGHLDWALPGYTHLQRAQPVYLSHHALAWFWMVNRDRNRFLAVEAASKRSMPLGAGALAGVNFDTDRRMVAKELGFDGVAVNSIDAVADRDIALELLSAHAICATHLSRIGAELVLWSSQEFNFVSMSDGWSSGSSIMPQKKNPDAAELLRAKAPRVVGHLAALHGVMHALPLTYNKDLQEDKEHLFDSAETVEMSIEAAARMLAAASFNREAMAEAAGDDLVAATDLADLLVGKGMPFRDAHGVVAALVRLAVESGRGLAELTEAEVSGASALLLPEYAGLLEPGQTLESKRSEGGTALDRVREQLGKAHAAHLSLG
ncbi:MAG: argininosuccinate lyase [Solirubrobacterales bacterium]|nr:argininosuccinate lyase [Solirubrobacterales bacterium]